MKVETEDCPVRLYDSTFLPPPAPQRSYEVPPVALAHTSGKGWSDAQAYCSCVGEAAERYSAMFRRGDETCLTRRYADIEQPAVPPSSLLQFSAKQYSTRKEWNAAFGVTQYIPHPWVDTDVLEWIACRSLSRGGSKLVPAGACFLRYLPPEPRIIFPNLTTGCAAGPSLDQAILRGFLELVERDAVALWWYNRCQRPAFAIDELADDHVTRTKAYLARHGRSLHVLDISTDFSIPVAIAVSATVEGKSILFGMAADFDLLEAVRRAVAELLQGLGPASHWDRSAMLDQHRLPTDRQAWIMAATLENQEYLLPAGTPAHIATTPAARPVSECLVECIAAATRAGTEILVCDLTRPDVRVPTVKVIAPGLRSSWAQLGPGRLYQTPVALGWQSRALTEEELNPFPFFL